MIFSKELMLSDDQAIVASAASTNVIDLGVPGTVKGAPSALDRDIGRGGNSPHLVLQVTEAFTLLTSLKVAIEVSAVENFASKTEIVSDTIALAELVPGTLFNPIRVPIRAAKRYMRAYYTVSGTNPDAGKITAGISMGVQTANPVPGESVEES